jgi:pimeloyl-ACP methyl ester carboxylesterase
VTQDGRLTLADGRTLAYAERGEPVGYPVVFHHGTPGSRHGHHPDPEVYRGIRFLTFDRPGYGLSDPLPGRRVADVAADVSALADHLGLERFAVFGASGGGPHALACAALHPDRVERALVMVGAAPSDDPEFDFTAGMAEVNLIEFGAALEGEDALATVLAPWVEQVADDPEGMLDRLAAELPDYDREVVSRPEIRGELLASFGESVRQGARGWIDDDLAFAAPWGFDLADVRPEVRLLQGELDVLVPRAHCEYLAGKLPRATFELVPGAGHLLFDCWPDALARLRGSPP